MAHTGPTRAGQMPSQDPGNGEPASATVNGKPYQRRVNQATLKY